MTNNIQSINFLRLRDVIARTGLSRSSVYDLMARGQFPRPVKLGVRASGWVEAEVTKWQAHRMALRDQEGRR